MAVVGEHVVLLRADLALVRAGLAHSRSRARDLIAAGVVRSRTVAAGTSSIGGNSFYRVVATAADLVSVESLDLSPGAHERSFVSRGIKVSVISMSLHFYFEFFLSLLDLKLVSATL